MNSYRAFVLTSLREEYLAVRSHLYDLKEEVHNGTVYEVGKFSAFDKSWEVAIIKLGRHSENAFVEAKLAINSFNPKVALFIGIAGGLKDVDIGDVVAATKVYSYDIDKKTNKFSSVTHAYQSSDVMIQRARSVARSNDWLKRIKQQEHDRHPSAFIAPIAVGQFVAVSASEIKNFLNSNYSDVVALTMMRLDLIVAYADQKISTIVVLGILDLIDQDQKTVDLGMHRIDAIQNACAFAFEVLATLDFNEGTESSAAIRMNNLPPRNPFFTGRESLLEQLRKILNSDKNISIVSITGMGGVGKTQLALEYTYRYADSYYVIWWVNSENPAVIAAEYSTLAKTLNLPEKDLGDQKHQAKLVHRWLENNSNWLLVFDNASNPGDIEDYLPKSGSGHVIITSRNPNWGTLTKPLHVQVFERPESVQFLFNRTDLKDENSANILAETLGDLPLALEMGGTYIKSTGISIEDYLELFRKTRMPLLMESSIPNGYPEAIVGTFNMSIEAAKKMAPVSVDLLTLCSFMEIDNIPRSLFVEGSRYLIEPLESIVKDLVEFDKTIAALRNYSLIDLNEKGISVHPLVRLIMRDRVDEADRKEWSKIAIALGTLYFSTSDSVPNWDDDAIKNTQEDKLGRAAFARYLSARISQIPASSDAHEAYMIHLYGPWGAGKSTVLNFLGEELDNSGEWLVARYNAWQNQHIDPPWWSLMDGIFQSIKAKLERRVLLWEYLWRISAGYTYYLIGVIIFFWIMALVFPFLSQDPSDTSSNLTIVAKEIHNNFTIVAREVHNNSDYSVALGKSFGDILNILAAIATISGFIIATKRSFLLGSSNAAETFVRLTNDPMIKIKSHFEDFAKKLKPKHLVILIDDLDRCQSKRVVELLEVTQTLFREANVVIVVVADHRWLNACYEQIYDKFITQIHQPGKPLGYLFLEKAFRFSTPIPGFNKNLKKKFWCYLLKVKTKDDDEVNIKKSAREASSRAKNESDLVHMSENLENRSFAEQTAFREEAVKRLAAPDIMERLEHALLPYYEFLEANPRAMKRLVNIYSANRALAILSDVQIELHQLALWTILQSRWPILAEYLEKNPKSLEKIGQENDLKKIPEELKILFTDNDVINVVHGGSFQKPLQWQTIDKCLQLHG